MIEEDGGAGGSEEGFRDGGEGHAATEACLGYVS